MKLNRQKEILLYLQKVESATLKEIYLNVSFSYYCNEMKHLGAVMSRMVKNGKVERIAKGVFKIKTKHIENLNQKNLF
jgi:hypothetical protein